MWLYNLYGAVLSSNTVTVDPNTKPIILWYLEELQAESHMQAHSQAFYIRPIILRAVSWSSILVKYI